MTLNVDTLYVQGNILITQDGQACLADFGSAFRDLTSHDHKLETLQYMAPEHCLEDLSINGPSKTGDVYSFTMTSFKVCPPAVNYPVI